MTSKKMLFQVIMQDEYNNLFHIGFYKQLEDATNEVNEWLSFYDTKLDEPLCVYPSSFNMAFDKEIETPEGDFVFIRGFIFNEEEFEFLKIIKEGEADDK